MDLGQQRWCRLPTAAITNKTTMLTRRVINCRELPDETAGGEEGETAPNKCVAKP